MSFQLNMKQITRLPATGRLAMWSLISAFLAIYLFAGIAIGAEYRLSDQYAMEINPAAKAQLGAEKYNEVMAFFHAAEEAIETKNLQGLMKLYSEDYENGGHDKKSIEQIWKRIFSTFESMTTHHYMELVNITATKKEAVNDTVVFRCSGILLGMHDPEKGVVTIDNWARQDHVLVREGGAWRLIGTFGQDRKRLWFDKPVHPLF